MNPDTVTVTETHSETATHPAQGNAAGAETMQAHEVYPTVRPQRVAVVGASGYTGAELLRLVAGHPHLELAAATTNSQPDTRLDKLHPHLRGATEEVRGLRTIRHEDAAALDVDVAMLAVPHRQGMVHAPGFVERGVQVVDLSADFRLRTPEAYADWYGTDHTAPDLLPAAYGIAELHRDEYPEAPLLAGAGCIATASILALHPLVQAGLVDPDHIVIDAKIGSSGSGARANPASHHVDRQRAIRPYGMTGHRHTAEIEQELTVGGVRPQVALSTHAVELVRGIFVTAHARLSDDQRDVTDRDLWQAYRGAYGDEPFMQIVKERTGVHRAPDPRLLAGTNVCAVGFERDPHAPRIVAMSALDNLGKGAAGAAIQNLNIALGLPETTGLDTVGLYPFA